MSNSIDSPRPEECFRRAEFLGGLPIRLADDQNWAFAGPREMAQANPSHRKAVAELLQVIAEAEDRAECRRSELALAIRLLSINYDLTPVDYTRLLSFETEDPRLATLQDEFQQLALRHAESLESPPATPAPEAAPAPVEQGRRFRFPEFPRRRPATENLGRDKKVC